MINSKNTKIYFINLKWDSTTYFIEHNQTIGLFSKRTKRYTLDPSHQIFW